MLVVPPRSTNLVTPVPSILDIFQLGGVFWISELNLIWASTLLKNPLKVKGIPFMAYKNLVCPSIVAWILWVGNSDENSFASGVIVVCNLVPVVPDCVPNLNSPPTLRATCAPYDIGDVDVAGFADELQELILEVEISAMAIDLLPVSGSVAT